MVPVVALELMALVDAWTEIVVSAVDFSIGTVANIHGLEKTRDARQSMSLEMQVSVTNKELIGQDEDPKSDEALLGTRDATFCNT